MLEIIHTSDINNSELFIYHGLSEPALAHYSEPAPGIFIAESPMIISRALDAGYSPVSVLMEERSPENSHRLLEQSGLLKSHMDFPVYAAPAEILKQITGYTLTRGILCAMRRHELPDPEQIIKRSSRIVILEEVMNPANTGSIFRSAAALGMDAVLLTKGCTDPLYRRSARVSMGTVFQIPWTYFRSWPEDINILKKNSYRVAAMTLSDSCIDLQDLHVSPDEKAALIMGTEGPGVNPGTLKLCDHAVKIPMANGVDSLNVAAASAVAFWYVNH